MHLAELVIDEGQMGLSDLLKISRKAIGRVLIL
jgi:hypothetical protein